jgi:hypothetical protein
MATLKETTIDPIDYSPIMAALRKARAGWWLIDAVEHGTRWTTSRRLWPRPTRPCARR